MGAIGAVLLVFVGAVACGANLLPGERSERGDGPKWVAFEDEEAGIAGRAPSGWSVVTGERDPEGTNPIHVASVSTIDLVRHAWDKRGSPLEELAPGQALVEVFERTGADPGPFEPWPRSFDPEVMDECPDPLECWKLPPPNDFEGWREDFARSGRLFHVFVFMGRGTVDGPVGSLAWRVLDEIRFTPKVTD